MKKPIEYKSISGKVKDVDEAKRIVTGYYTNTGSLDSDGDIFAEGAFKKTIKEQGPSGKNRIWHLWQHDTLSPINKPYKLEETKEGVYFETVFPKHAIADMVLALYAEGASPEHSVGFMTLSEEQDKKARIIKQVRMLEGSTVLWGANENTPFTGMKSEQEAKQRINMFETLLTKGAFKNEDIHELLYREIERLKAIVEARVSSNRVNHSTEHQPPKRSLPKFSIKL